MNGVGCRLKVEGCRLFALVNLQLIRTFLALLLFLRFAFALTAADALPSTQQLILVLQSDAGTFEKARACQQLGERGTAEAVPVLATLLNDPKLSAYARSGLEGIPDPSAVAALRKAAQELKGPLLAGVINSLGVLRDTQSVELLSGLAAQADSGVVSEALLALGNISSAAAIQILEAALANGPEAYRPQAAAACLLAADRQRVSGDRKRATAVYELVRNSKVPDACLAGATRGAILSREQDRATFLVEQLRSSNLAIREAALFTVREIPDNALATALNAEVPHASAELQPLLLWALADCHNSESVRVVQTLAGSPSPAVRRTALVVLGKLGPGAAQALLELMSSGRPADENALILGALRTLPGSTVDDLLLQALSSASSASVRVDLMRLAENRGVSRATPKLLKALASSDQATILAALSALRSLGGAGDVPNLIHFTKSCGDDQVRTAAEGTVVGICNRSGAASAELVLTELKQAAEPGEMVSWIRVLARVGYAKALPTLESAVTNSPTQVAETAITELGRWPNPAPIETLLATVDSASTPALRQLALTSVLDLAAAAADDNLAPAPTIAGWLRQANSAAQSLPDRRRILGILGRVKTVDSFRLLLPYLQDSSLQTEAAAGIVQIAPAIATGETGQAVQASLDKIAATTPNADLRSRATQTLKTIANTKPPVQLFDSVSLSGWDGDTNVWRVQGGVIVGGSMKGNPRNEFLATQRSYTNFLLQLEYKLVGTEGFVNSGVQVRSVRSQNPPNEMIGYQADIGASYSGCLYDESRRNTVLARANEETIKRVEAAGDWNRYEIRCEGAHIQLWLNGEKTVDYTETDATINQSGRIGLQIHGGNKAEVSFRNITILEL
jgi:HEAT repeat protein